MTTVRVCHEIPLPDPLRVGRLLRAPELGPRLLFFTGGTALRDTSRALVAGTHNSIHIVTPFDSGGSSAVLRKAFAMPAIGDARARIMALADQTLRGAPDIYELFAYRFARDGGQQALRQELSRMVAGRHPRIARVPDPMRKIIRSHLQTFMEAMPDDFDMRGASTGNLVLAAGYLMHRRMLDPVIYIFSRLVQARGEVRPVVNRNLHLAARLDDGRVVPGQHAITGKETRPLHRRIEEVFLTDGVESVEPVRVPIRQKMRDLIASADVICYPPGSFHTSLLATLLPDGVPSAVAANPCPKVYVPSTGEDPEAFGLTVAQQVGRLVATLTREGAGRESVLDLVLVDTRNAVYPGGLDVGALRDFGVQVADCALVTARSAPRIDGERLAQVLLSLA